jgi:hypothetical protein
MAHVHSIRPRIALQLAAAHGLLTLGCGPMSGLFTLRSAIHSDNGTLDDDDPTKQRKPFRQQ